MSERDYAELACSDRVGRVFVPREAFLKVMEELGLKEYSSWRGSRVFFRGKIEDIKVEVVTYQMTFMPTRGGKGTGYQFCQNHRNTPTHFKLKYWMPENVHLTGKGRDGKAWMIFRLIGRKIEEARGNPPMKAYELKIRVVDEVKYMYRGLPIYWVKPGYYHLAEDNVYRLVNPGAEPEKMTLIGYYDIEEVK